MIFYGIFLLLALGSMGNTCCVKADDEQSIIDNQKSNNALDNATDANTSSASSLDHQGTRILFYY